MQSSGHFPRKCSSKYGIFLKISNNFSVKVRYDIAWSRVPS